MSGVVAIRGGSTSSSHSLFMSTIVLPGERVPAQHVNLKLGPGLLQLSAHHAPAHGQPIISTRGGQLHHSANNSRWWVEGNGRRASVFRLPLEPCVCAYLCPVCSSAPRERDRCRPRTQGRGMASRHRVCTSCAARRTRIRRRLQEEQAQPQGALSTMSNWALFALCRASVTDSETDNFSSGSSSASGS